MNSRRAEKTTAAERTENMIEKIKYWLFQKGKDCKRCCLRCRYYDICRWDVLGNVGLQSEETITLLAIENSKPHKDGLDIVTEQIEDAKAFNQTLKLAGVLITSYQNTDGEAAGVEWLEEKTDFNILGIIRYSKKVAENTFMRKPIYEYSPCCGAAQGYKKFVTAYTGKAR